MSKDFDNMYPFLANGGKMGELIANYEWAKTDLGDVGSWSQNLRTTINIVLQSNVPMVVLWGKDGRMIYNEAYSVFAGARHPLLLGAKVLDGWPEVADFNRNVMRVCLAGKTLTYENRQLVLYRNNVEETVWTNLNYSPIMDETGKPVAVLAIVIETTEKVLAEQNLSSTRAQLDSALAVGLTSTWSWDMKRDVIIGDVNFAKSFGITNEEARIGLPMSIILESIHADDRERVVTGINETINSGAVYEQEYRTINHHGDIVWVIARGSVRNDEDNNPRYFVGVLIDITERKLAQQDLVETKQKFDALFDSNVMAIAMAKTDGTILQGNKTFLKLFDYSKKDLEKGLNSTTITAPQSRKISKEIYSSIERKGEAEPTEKTYVRKDGTQFPAIVGAAKLPDNKDTFMAFILDISENQRLKELNTAKDEFIALASHQLRTPASTVKQYLGVLLEEYAGPLSQEQLKYLAIANRANDRQLAIIDDLLKTAQIDTKGYNLTFVSKDLVNIVRTVISQYESTLDARKQKIKFRTSKNKITVPIDETEISICIANLIENAAKYSRDGTTVTIELKASPKYAELIISDKGVGINEKDQLRVFDKFTRVDNELSDTVTGSGLGLYWVKRIVDIHKGDIVIHSIVGKGTSFTVRLPYEP